jgi:hypothetical protein
MNVGNDKGRYQGDIFKIIMDAVESGKWKVESGKLKVERRRLAVASSQ